MTSFCLPFCLVFRVRIWDVPDLDTGIRYPVKFGYPVASGKILPYNISDFEIGETGVKTLERELKSC